jgi:hypothetical protein
VLKAAESKKEHTASVPTMQKDTRDESNTKLPPGGPATESKVGKAVKLPKSAPTTARTEPSLAPSSTGDPTVYASLSSDKKKVRKPKDEEKVAEAKTNGQTTISTTDKNASEIETPKSSQSLYTSSTLNPPKASVDKKGTKKISVLELPNDDGNPSGEQKNDEHAGEAGSATLSSSLVLENTKTSVSTVASKSWAGVCSPAPLRNISDSPTSRQKPVLEEATASGQVPPALTTPSVPSTNPSDPATLGFQSDRLAHGSNLSTKVGVSKYGGVQPTSNPPTEKLQVVGDDVKHLATSEPILSEADFPALPPASPPTKAALPSASYAKIAHAPSKSDTSPPQKTIVPAIQAYSPVVNQPLDSLYVMIRQERQALLTGPKITIYSGAHTVTGIFKRAAMAVSSVLNAHFTAHPSSLSFHLSPEDTVTPGAIRYLLDTYMHSTSLDFEAHAVPMQNTFPANIAILHAARKLGMEPYTRHILTSHVIYLKEHIPSYEEIAVVERNKTGDKDPLWTHMLNHLCHARYQGYIPDPESFEAFVEKHSALKEAMEKTDRFFYGESARRHGELGQRRAG